jgi:hypothetical protein
VQLRAFNLLGQRIATLLDDERAQGEYEIIWHGSHDDGTPTSSGVYLLEMRTPSQREVRTVVLVR